MMSYADYEVDRFLDKRRRQVHIHTTIAQLYHIRLIDDDKLIEWMNHILLIHQLFPELVPQGYEWKLFCTWPVRQLPPTTYSTAIASKLMIFARDWL